MTIDKRFCIVRNVFDVVPSCLSLWLTLSHTAVPDMPWNKFRSWDSQARYWSNSWVKYHNRLREEAKITPTFFMTYE